MFWLSCIWPRKVVGCTKMPRWAIPDMHVVLIQIVGRLHATVEPGPNGEQSEDCPRVASVEKTTGEVAIDELALEAWSTSERSISSGNRRKPRWVYDEYLQLSRWNSLSLWKGRGSHNR